MANVVFIVAGAPEDSFRPLKNLDHLYYLSVRQESKLFSVAVDRLLIEQC